MCEEGDNINVNLLFHLKIFLWYGTQLSFPYGGPCGNSSQEIHSCPHREESTDRCIAISTHWRVD